jgi:hypothetical protein
MLTRERAIGALGYLAPMARSYRHSSAAQADR